LFRLYIWTSSSVRSRWETISTMWSYYAIFGQKIWLFKKLFFKNNFFLDLAGKNEWEEAKAMEIIFLNDEMGYAVEPYIDAMFGFHEGNVVCSNTDKCL